jgi:hypothetical protein
MVPKADWNPIDLSAIDGGLHPFGPRHVLDLKSAPRRIASFRFCHDGNAPACRVDDVLTRRDFAAIQVD